MKADDIFIALKELHIALWEEMRAPIGHHYLIAENKRKLVERKLRGKLAKYNPRDINILDFLPKE